MILGGMVSMNSLDIRNSVVVQGSVASDAFQASFLTHVSCQLL